MCLVLFTYFISLVYYLLLFMFLCLFYLCVFVSVFLFTVFCMSSLYFCFFFFKQKTAYDMRISDWSSDVCSSDLYGIVNPFANRCKQVIEEDGAIYHVVKQIIVASLHGHPQPLVIEAARSSLSHANQPAFAEVFDGMRGK